VLFSGLLFYEVWLFLSNFYHINDNNNKKMDRWEIKADCLNSKLFLQNSKELFLAEHKSIL
jgi:hypothetical protein